MRHFLNYETFQQQELDVADASQEDYDDEAEFVRLTEEEVYAARTILKTKQMEWDIIKTDEKLDKAAKRKELRDEERNKRTQQMVQQVIAAIPAAVTPNVTVNAQQGVAQATRLPQRQIRHFKGYIQEWTSFWETSNATIHTSNLTAVQKFDYFKEYLKGETRLFVENLELTDVNYQIAIDELKKTYGKKEVLINAHFDKLDSLQPVKDAKDVAALRNLQLTIQSHISALETLGKEKTTYGSLLGTKLVKLIPYKLQEKWAEV